MKKEYPPVALVEAWIFIQNSKHEEIIHSKNKSYMAIKAHFGSIEIAQMYVDEFRCDNEELKVS